MTVAQEPRTLLRTGEQYKESLRDGRTVWYRGERIEDVTTHPVTAPAIEFQARIYDAQHDPRFQDELTYVREDGMRVTSSWIVPRSREALEQRLREAELRAWLSLGGMHARQPHHIPSSLTGQLGYMNSHFRRLAPAYADNLARLIAAGEEQNLHCAASAIEVQGNARAAKAGADREHVGRVVRRTADGVYISGAKAVGSAAVQADELVLGSIAYPHVRGDEAFWCMVPVASPGLSLVCRESALPVGSPGDHPLARLGDEMDAMVLLDEVFVPHERIWALDAPELCDPGLFGLTARNEFLLHLVRKAVRAEVFCGLAESITDVLETQRIPLVQDHLGELSQWAVLLRSGVVAAMAQAAPNEEGIWFADGTVLTAFRAYGLDAYPRMANLLQVLAAQGPVMRFSERDWAIPELALAFDRYLATDTMTASDKNALMSLVWDVCASTLATRTQIFENVNGLPAPVLRNLLSALVDRTPWAERVLDTAGIHPRLASRGGVSTTGLWPSGREADR
jgi:4-hydroxyphenylacetate 3-monooxygenase